MNRPVGSLVVPEGSTPAERAREVARGLWHRVPPTRQAALLQTAPARLAYRHLWARPGHFYSPFADLADLAGRPAVWDRTELPGVDLHADDQVALVSGFDALTDDLPEQPTDGWRYHLDNVPFPWADGLALAGMLRHHRPTRVVEVGSGWSTRLLLDVRDRDVPDLALTVIDPFPRLSPTDAASVDLRSVMVQDAPFDVFDALGPGDVLFVDSSHVAKAGSDVTHLCFDVLPRLKPGVLLHVHDVHWPFEYPESWVRQGRAWNEAYLVHALVLGGLLDVVLWVSWLGATRPDVLTAHLPRAFGNTGGSLWLRVRPRA